MTLTVRHAKVSSGSVDPNAEVDGADWNQDHQIIGSEVAGSDLQVQFNSGGTFAGTGTLSIPNVSGYQFVGVGDNIPSGTARASVGKAYLVMMDRLVNWASINDNTIVDLTDVRPVGNGTQYASYACGIRTIDTAFNYNHLNGFGDLKTYNGSGTLTDEAGFFTLPTFNGPTTNRRGLYVANAQGTGTLANQYGVYIASLTKGTLNWGVYSVGVAPSYFGGNLLVGTADSSIPAPITINKNVAPTPTTFNGNTLLQLTNADGLASNIELNSFATSSAVVSRVAGNTKASPSAVTSGTPLLDLVAQGYGTNTYGATLQGVIEFVALETFTNTAKGTALDFYTTSIGAATNSRRARVGDGLMVGTTTDRGAGTLNLSGSLFLGSFTVAGLPSGVAAGQTAYATNCRVFNGAGTQEGAAAGTGGLVVWNGSAWKIAGTNVTAVA